MYKLSLDARVLTFTCLHYKLRVRGDNTEASFERANQLRDANHDVTIKTITYPVHVQTKTIIDVL